MNTTPTVSVSRLGSVIAALMLTGLLSAPWQTATAAPVTSKQAAAVVTGWLSLDQTPLGETLGTSVQRVETFNDPSGNPLYYVAYLNPSGFVIVAGDDLVEPIVGFTSAGQFDPSNNNPLGALVSSDLAGRVAYARQAGSVPPDTNALQAQAKWQRLAPTNGGPVITPNGLTSVSDVRMAPLTQSTWSQQTAGSRRHTCLLQLLHAALRRTETPPTIRRAAWRPPWPSSCGTISFLPLASARRLSRSLRMALLGPITTRGGDGSGGAYVWSNMPLVPPANPTLTQCQAIGALVADAGATVNMELLERRVLVEHVRRQSRIGQYLSIPQR